MLQSPREETEGKLQMLVSPRENSRDALFKEVRVLKGRGETKGRFLKVLAKVCSFRFFWGPGISKIIAFFCIWIGLQGKTLEEISVQGNICQNHPFGNSPFANPECFFRWFLASRGNFKKSPQSGKCKVLIFLRV